jgi:predicted nucleic acid-binding protein
MLCQRPSKSPEVFACHQWLRSLAAGNWDVYLPEIADYELRRELLRLGNMASIARLDKFQSSVHYLSITTPVMRRAAQEWANVRIVGMPTADRHALDADVILVAQALTLSPMPTGLIVATSNPAHISRFLACDLWTNIVP